GLHLQPSGEKRKVVSITGGGIHPVAKKIADMLEVEAVDGFSKGVPEEQIICAVIDCGGTARVGVYPMKRIPTVDVIPSSPSGPLYKYITEDIFVSGVTVNDVLEDVTNVSSAREKDTESNQQQSDAIHTRAVEDKPSFEEGANSTTSSSGKSSWLISLSKGIGYVVGVLYQAGRDSIDMLIRNILPFMAYVGLLMGIVTYTGLGKIIAHVLGPLAGSLPGLLLIVIIATLPFLSPVLGPGAVIAQIIGVLVGSELATGSIAPQYALPALFAIDGQVGCDFIPVALALGEAKPETVEYGVPAVLYSRMITGIIAVVIAWLASFGLYSR
ncbi:PTS sorbitol transporter subunit IIB, partial [Alicyclobacillaceae bacterium I2511]